MDASCAQLSSRVEMSMVCIPLTLSNVILDVQKLARSVWIVADQWRVFGIMMSNFRIQVGFRLQVEVQKCGPNFSWAGCGTGQGRSVTGPVALAKHVGYLPWMYFVQQCKYLFKNLWKYLQLNKIQKHGQALQNDKCLETIGHRISLVNTWRLLQVWPRQFGRFCIF